MRETGDGRYGKWEVLHFIALRVKPQINAETTMTEEKRMIGHTSQRISAFICVLLRQYLKVHRFVFPVSRLTSHVSPMV
jgi:hypothetical protein